MPDDSHRRRDRLPERTAVKERLINRDGQDEQDEQDKEILDLRLKISRELSQLCFYPVYPVHPC
jgi:hypothetical protein